MILFTDSFLLSPPTTIPLTNARILWNDYPKTWTASTEETNFEAVSVANPMTFRRWRATASTSWLKAEMDTGEDVNAIGIAAHNLAGKTVTIEHSEDDSAWTTLESFVPADNESILVLFENLVKPWWRISVSGGIAEIGVVFIGQTLDMYRSIFGGVQPPRLSGVRTQLKTRSESGQYTSNKVIRRGISTSLSWRHLPGGWIRSHFMPFAEYASDGNPFFIAWRPSKYPEDVAYTWTGDNIHPTNMGILDYMQVGFSIDGFRE